MHLLGLSLVAWTFAAAALLFLALVAAGYVLQLARDAKRLSREVSDAADRLRVAGDEVRTELERAGGYADDLRSLAREARSEKDRRRGRSNPGGIG